MSTQNLVYITCILVHLEYFIVTKPISLRQTIVSENWVKLTNGDVEIQKLSGGKTPWTPASWQGIGGHGEEGEEGEEVREENFEEIG